MLLKAVDSFRKSTLLKSFSIYVFSSFFNQGINFLLLPVFTHYLLPSDYGVLSVVNSVISIMTVFIMVGADGAIRRQFYKLEGNQYAQFFTSSLFVCVVAFLIISVLTFGATALIGPIAQIPVKWLLLCPLICFTSILPTVLLGQYRVQQKASAFAVLSNLMTLANLGLAIWLVVGAGMNYEGRLYSILIVNICFFLISFFIVKKQKLLTNSLNKVFINESIKYGLPIIPHQLGALIISFSDRFFIVARDGTDDAGIYSVGYTIAGIIGILEGTFTLAYTPFLFEQLSKKNEEANNKIVKVSYLFIAALAVSVLLLCLASPWIFKYFIDERFAEGQIFVVWVSIGYFFSGCYKMMAGYIFYSSKTIYLTYLSIINIALNLGLNYVLIGKMGAMGAAIATMLSYIVMFLITTYISNRLNPMPWFWFKMKH